MSKRSKKKVFKIKKRGRRQKELFNISKFKKSLQRSGLDESMCEDLLKQVDPEKSYYQSTASLFRRTHDAIYKKSKKLAAHYNIKRSILELGPTGYPFEILGAEIFKTKGFKTKVSVIKKGVFVSHEIDVVAKRPDLTIFCECKFHRNSNHKNDIKLPLYVYARYLDLKNTKKYKKVQYAIMTNTDFSEDAIKYSEGVGLMLFSLDYPDKNTFIDLMKQYKVYPVTILKTLKKKEAALLLEKKIVVIKHLKVSHLENLGLTKERILEVKSEIKELLNNYK